MICYKLLIAILVIFLKTGNVLSLENIFNVNNIEIAKKPNNSNDDLANKAIKKGFEKLLEKILLNRDINDEKNAMERMKQFDEDVRHWKNYDLVVINDDFIKCYKKIIKYINSKINNISVSYDKNEIDKHILNLLK